MVVFADVEADSDVAGWFVVAAVEVWFIVVPEVG